MKNDLRKILSSALKSTAKVSAETTSVLCFHEPKMPKILLKSEKAEERN